MINFKQLNAPIARDIMQICQKKQRIRHFVLKITKAVRRAGQLFCPRVCAGCRGKLLDGEDTLCTRCRYEIPLTYFWREPDNEIRERLSNTIPVENASAFYFYGKSGVFRDMMHRFKYRHQKRIGLKLGRWYGRELAETGRYRDLDLIIPLPLHPLRRLERGYNQSEWLARGLSDRLGVPVDARSVVRVKRTRSQSVKKERKERMQNVQGVFGVRRPGALQGKHLLLVDDVLTTGSTLESCARTILKAVPDCRLSIAALAYARHRY